jgi:hypothetical protein
MIHRDSCQAAVLSNALQPGCSSHQLCVVIHNVDKRAASLFSVAFATHCGCFTHNIVNCCAVPCCAVLHLRHSGLWRVRSWSPRMDLVPEFLCSVQGMTGMVADIALSSNGGEQAAAAAAYVVLPCYSYCRSASRRHPRTEAPPQEHHSRHLSNACETETWHVGGIAASQQNHARAPTGNALPHNTHLLYVPCCCCCVCRCVLC